MNDLDKFFSAVNLLVASGTKLKLALLYLGFGDSFGDIDSTI